jgi:hypothetical protein
MWDIDGEGLSEVTICNQPYNIVLAACGAGKRKRVGAVGSACMNFYIALMAGTPQGLYSLLE